MNYFLESLQPDVKDRYEEVNKISPLSLPERDALFMLHWTHPYASLTAPVSIPFASASI